MTRNRFVIAVAAGAILGGAMGPGADAQTPVPARDLARARPPALRPAVAGPNGGISTGHPLTSAAALEILLKGGNAFDAGAAILLVGGVVEQDLESLGGEALVLVYPENGAPFDKSDFAEFYARIEAPVKTTYRGYTVYKQSFTSQGPVLLQTLNILENFDLQAMGHDSPDYIHTVTEGMKLAYADRDSFYADTDFVQVPEEGLLSQAYAGFPQPGRVLGCVVSESPPGLRMAAVSDPAPAWVLLAAPPGPQPAEPRGGHSRRRLRRIESARPCPEPPSPLWDVRVRHRGHD